MSAHLSRQSIVTANMYQIVVPELVDAFSKLEASAPKPSLVGKGRHQRYRFAKNTDRIAILLKLSRIVTGVQAEWAVLSAGFPQEAAALQRILDELGSDLQFLAGPLTVGAREASHDQFLADFFQEEFEDGKTPAESSHKRNRVPRKKIRSYNAKTFTPHEPVDRVVAVQETIDAVYSGFVHGAGAQIMDMYGGEPPRFHVAGMKNTSRLDSAFVDFRNYLHRALMDASVAARALGNEALSVELMHKSDNVGKAFGTLPN